MAQLPTAKRGLTLTCGNIKLAIVLNQWSLFYFSLTRGRNETSCDLGARCLCFVHCNRHCARCGAVHQDQPDVNVNCLVPLVSSQGSICGAFLPATSQICPYERVLDNRPQVIYNNMQI